MGLAWFCKAKETDFQRLGQRLGNNVFIDRNAPILAVAHLDTVQQKSFYREDKHNVYSPYLDDRLGAWIITEVLPKMGIAVDVLLTTNEEMGMSTANEFNSNKEYNWIVEFDRSGTDAVTYQYDNLEWLNALDKYWVLGRGSYSDIYDLEHLSISAVNIGVGYYDYHKQTAYAVKSEIKTALAKFKRFYSAYSGTRFEHEVKPRVKYSSYTDWLYQYDRYPSISYKAKAKACALCDMPLAHSHTDELCTWCRNDVACVEWYNKHIKGE